MLENIIGPLVAGLASFNSDKPSPLSATAKETPTDTSSNATTFTKSTGKGALNYGTLALTPETSSTILQKMQDEYDRRTNKGFLNQLNRDLQEATAWSYGPEALLNLQKQREEEAKNAFDMQLQIQQFKAAQEQRKIAQQNWDKMYGSESPYTAQGTTGPSRATSPMSGLDPDLIKQANALMSTGDYTGANKLINDAVAKKNEAKFNPEFQKLVKVKDPSRGIIEVPLSEAWKYSEENPTANITNEISAVPPSSQTGIQPQHIAKVESGNTPFAVGPEVPGQGSAKSAMQVMDATATNPGFGVKPAELIGDPTHDEAERVRVGTDYFNAMKQKYGNDTLASMAQNWGPGNVDKWIAEGADINRIPPETKDYIAKAHLTAATDNIPKRKNIAMPSASAGVGTVSQRAPIKEEPYNPPSTVITAEENKPLPNETTNAYNARIEALKAEKQKAREVYDAQYKKMADTNAETVAQLSKEESTNEAKKRNEFMTDYNSADSAFNNFKDLLEASKNHQAVFNLRGQNIAKYWLGRKLQPGGLEHSASPNAELIQLESPENQSAYNNIGVGSANATGAWAKQLVSNGGGNRLTNADLKLGSLAKGVGTDMTYDAHMNNLAHNMEVAKTMELRAKGWHQFHENNPNATTADYEASADYKAARDQAKLIVGKIFKEANVPEVYADPSKNKTGYLHADKNKRPYIILSNGDRVYI